jgi:NAD(P)-dependent dehydrogenase (short-subunit alcohol dehydrogenase family)
MNIQEQFSMKDELAIVTGAGGGLGSELAKIGTVQKSWNLGNRGHHGACSK